MTQVTEESGARHYIKNDLKYPSVTTIIGDILRKPFLEKWRGDVGNREANRRRDEAGEHGKMIHNACGLAMRGHQAIPLELSDIEVAQIDAFERWHNLAVEEVLAVEERVFNGIYVYAGTLDERAILKGDTIPTIIDLKTGHFDEDACRMQTGAYREGDGIEAHRRIIVDLKNLKDGLPKIHEFKDHGQDYQAFLWALSIYNWKRGVRH